MSKGPGRRQQRLLEELARRPYVLVRDLVGPEATRSEMEAFRRAAHRLAERGQAQLVRWWYCPGCGTVWDPRLLTDHRNCAATRRTVLVLTTDEQAGLARCFPGVTPNTYGRSGGGDRPARAPSRRRRPSFVNGLVVHLLRWRDTGAPGMPPWDYADPEDGYRLGQQVVAARSVRNGGLLSSKQIEALTQAGIVWETRRESACQQVAERVRAYVDQHGSGWVPAHYRCRDLYHLGAAMTRYRAAYRDGRLTGNQVRMLEDAGVVWNKPSP